MHQTAPNTASTAFALRCAALAAVGALICGLGGVASWWALTAGPLPVSVTAALDQVVARGAAVVLGLIAAWWGTALVRLAVVGARCAREGAGPDGAPQLLARSLPHPVRLLASAVLGVSVVASTALPATASASPPADPGPTRPAAVAPGWPGEVLRDLGDGAGTTAPAPTASASAGPSPDGPPTGTSAPAPPGPVLPPPASGPDAGRPGVTPSWPAATTTQAPPVPARPLPAPPATEHPSPRGSGSGSAPAAHPAGDLGRVVEAHPGDQADAHAPGWTPVRPTQQVVSAAPDLGLDRGRPVTMDDHEVVVRRGDTLWDVCARHLGPDATAAQVAAEWPRWHEANRAVIGPDPDHIEPGQRLQPPAGATP
ncbi:LysM peptidoglycan-binding domain-containing protein [Thalassiella azotivora]